MSNKLPISKSEFMEAVKDHTLTVIRDDGNGSRHLRFAAGDSFHQQFYLITWDGHLCYTGDMGTYVFKYYNIDMFGFFRNQNINSGYWKEKLQAVDYSALDRKEFNKHGYTLRYIWCLYAIVWGIGKYDEQTEVADA